MKAGSRAGALFMMIFALPFIGVGVYVVGLAVRNYQSAQAMQAWEPVQAELLAHDLRVNRGDDSTTYQATARYRYTVDGRNYESTRVGIHGGSDNVGTWQQDRHADLQRASAAGGRITAYVNPANPSDAVLFPEMRSGMMWFMGGFGGVFGAVGLGVFIGGFVGLFRGGASRKLAREYPNEPWRWREDWAGGVVKAGNRAAAIGILVFSTFWSGFVGFAFAMALLNRGQVPVPAWIILGVFQLVGIGLIAWAIRELRVARRYGAAIFHMASVPGVLGGKLAGVVAVPSYAEPYESYDVEIACERTVRRGKNTSTETLWKDERRLDPAKLPAKVDGVQVPVLFALPHHLPPSEGNVNWRLRVRGKQAGPDLDLRFEVPVFHTPESRPDFQLDESGITPYLLADPPARA